jgi:hypothetical protein
MEVNVYGNIPYIFFEKLFLWPKGKIVTPFSSSLTAGALYFCRKIDERWVGLLQLSQFLYRPQPAKDTSGQQRIYEAIGHRLEG